ncbi:MAG: helix-turn-helix transcriptional regulator [Proteobacteria bacterium]|nr:helix-turn-helix transcriptional regulator [Pseudomonadota bacterium]
MSTSLPTSWGTGRASSYPAVAPESGAVALVDLDRVWLRHQALGAFRLDYDGRYPMLVFLFTAAQPLHGGPPCPKGSFTLLVPGRPKTLAASDPVETLTVAFDNPAAAGRLMQALEPGRKATDPGVRAIAHEMRRVILREGPAAVAYLQHLADSLIARALQVWGAPKPPAPRASISPFNLRRVREHIDSRLGERITVSELAAVAGLSRAYFTRAFHAETGDSPHGFILGQRLAEVRRRLDDGADDLAHIAAQTGFSSHAHMTTAFGQAFGLTPRAYRERRLLDRAEAAANDPDPSRRPGVSKG